MKPKGDTGKQSPLYVDPWLLADGANLSTRKGGRSDASA